MKYKVTQIEMDFHSDEAYCPEYDLDVESQDELYDEVMSTVWDADNEKDLIEEITCAYGWCVKNIDYVIVLNS